MTTTTALTSKDIVRAATDERWDGYGYLGERRNCPDPEVTIAVDRFVIEIANQKRWTYEKLFRWANSKPGRWFAERAFSDLGGMSPEQIDRYFVLVKDGE